MTDDPKGKPDDPGRSEDAQDPDREGGLGAPIEPPGQADAEPPATTKPAEPDAERPEVTPQD